MTEVANETVRNEIGFLGTVLGETILASEGQDALDLVEALRLAAWQRREGDAGADEQIKSLIQSMDHGQVRLAVRAFSVFLDLLNQVEDRRRTQVLNERSRDAYPNPRGESVAAASQQLRDQNLSTSEVQSVLDSLSVELVFTAHPTEAKRRSVRHKLRVIRDLMKVRENCDSPQEKDRVEASIRGEVSKLWQTNFIRPWRPSVMQEVQRGLSVQPVLWKVIPEISRDLRASVKEFFGDSVTPTETPISFGSWIGGDRDGHPGVTADVTQDTVDWLRRAAIDHHDEICVRLFDSLSLSQRQTDFGPEIAQAISDAVAKWSPLEDRISFIPPDELCRRWISIIRWRLARTKEAMANGEECDATYFTACELAGDAKVLANAIRYSTSGAGLVAEVEDWQSQINTFGLHLARLDIRQNATVHREVIHALLQESGASESPESLDEAAYVQLLRDQLNERIDFDSVSLPDVAAESTSLFKLLHETVENYGAYVFGAYVISMTAAPSDVLSVLWLWKKAELSTGQKPGQESTCLPIVPLLETIDDLKNGPGILEGMLAIPEYRQHLKRQGDKQVIMLGYSDSTKDGGYLAACWALYEAQQSLVAVAAKQGIEIVFFHGRGGSLGRGGGPAARSILSLPTSAFNGALRLTEQGEVLADRYDDPAIAYRHLEQVVWSSLLAGSRSSSEDELVWGDLMTELSDRSLAKYHELIHSDGFVPFFRSATPIAEVEQLPIGSRPSRRKPGGGLSDLRAIPWVFSWTQSRCLVPAWYGLGTAIESMAADPSKLESLKLMYQKWPFFRALVDNAELALAKSDAAIAREYASLASDDQSAARIGEMVAAEFARSCSGVLALTEQEDLLGGTPWLRESIRVRNRFIDPLNLIQIELLKRSRAAIESDGSDQEELRHLTRLSINGVAAGMRTSG